MACHPQNPSAAWGEQTRQHAEQKHIGQKGQQKLTCHVKVLESRQAIQQDAAASNLSHGIRIMELCILLDTQAGELSGSRKHPGQLEKAVPAEVQAPQACRLQGTKQCGWQQFEPLATTQRPDEAPCCPAALLPCCPALILL